MNIWKTIATHSTTTLVLIGLLSVLLIFRLSKNAPDNSYRTIASDGIGYYQYLPNVFLDNSIKTQKPDKRFFNEINGKGVNKYFAGTAVAMYPFFQIGYWFAKDKKELKGNDPIFQRAISFAGLFYLLGGLFFLSRLLKRFEFNELTISLTLLLVFFGSNLLAYSILFPSMSHVYSFFFISGFLFFVKCFSDNKKRKSLLWSMLFLGMIILIRPLNGIIILAIPFLLDSWEEFKNTFNSALKPINILLSLLIVIGVLFVQSYLWYLQCGDWLIWSYSGEGFYFFKPYLREFLFSFRKGAFIYSPILLLSMLGIVVIFRKNRFKGWSISAFVLLLFYVLSSWWNWYYGPSFGQRPLVEFYAVFGLLIAFLMKAISNPKGRMVVGFLSVCFVLLNVIQTYQYHKGIISWWDMNFQKYSYTFLKTGESYRDCLGGNLDLLPYKPEMNTVFGELIDFENKKPSLEFGNIQVEDLPHKTVVDYSNTEFNFSMTIPCNDSFVTNRGIYIIADYYLKDMEISNKNGALFVVDISDSAGNNYHYGTFPIRNIPAQKANEWIYIHNSIEIKEIRNATDRIKIYIWNKAKERFYIDDCELIVLAID